MKQINVSNKTVFVDDDDYEKISKFKWNCSKHGYARRNIYKKGKYTTIWMHHLIMMPPSGYEIDHKNGNILDNRKVNLRVVTHAQNMKNTRLRQHTSSKFKGVSWFKETKKWMAYISVDGERHHLGLFQHEVDAAMAYNRAAIKYHGDFAKLNPIAATYPDMWLEVVK